MATFKAGQRVRIVADWSRHCGAAGVVEGTVRGRYRVSLDVPPVGEESYVREYFRRELEAVEAGDD